MPKFTAKVGPRKSNTGTPVPGGGDDLPTLADKLNYADLPRPFKQQSYVSKLPYRTASTSTTGVKKNVKQILTLERERVSGGDGFLTASQTAARARGEVVEPAGSKKKKTGPGAGGGGVNNLPNKRGFNLKNRKSGGTNTPLTQDGVLESGQTTPNTGNNGDDDGEGEDEEDESVDQAVKGDLELNVPHKEVITYHTPAAPPSLLPAKKYCDITGLHANYTDPRTKLRYKGLDVWHVVRSLGPGSDQAYLALRGAQTSLK